jgi:catechol 2,3-dioxygenase-like lactoylglutathione lyase family enzyme
VPIQRIESLTYGVADVALGTRFLEDLGLEKVEAGETGASFRTPTNQFVHLRRMDDPALPAAPESGPTLRETVWGVDSRQSLEAIGADLARDREVKLGADGSLHAHDETGFALGFAVANATRAAPQAPAYNNYESSRRVNERVAHRLAMQPTRIGHVVYLIRPEGRERASAFYLERLGFRLTDRSVRVGDFMRVQGTADHHSLLLMWIRQKPVRFDHAALEVAGFDDVLASGGHMASRGWKGTWGPGRQSLGSHVFWHFENPCGGEIELFTDMDRFDDDWQPKVWEDATPGPVWTIGEGPAELRRGMAAPGAPQQYEPPQGSAQGGSKS